jgi:prevent-host-death family protein
MEKLLINADDFIGTRELRAHMTSILNDVKESNRTIVVTTQGKPAGVLLSVEGYLSMLEEIQDLQNADLIAAIAQARKDIAKGKGESLDNILEERAKTGTKKITKKRGKAA